MLLLFPAGFQTFQSPVQNHIFCFLYCLRAFLYSDIVGGFLVFLVLFFFWQSQVDKNKAAQSVLWPAKVIFPEILLELTISSVIEYLNVVKIREAWKRQNKAQLSLTKCLDWISNDKTKGKNKIHLPFKIASSCVLLWRQYFSFTFIKIRNWKLCYYIHDHCDFQSPWNQVRDW